MRRTCTVDQRVTIRKFVDSKNNTHTHTRKHEKNNTKSNPCLSLYGVCIFFRVVLLNLCVHVCVCVCVLLRFFSRCCGRETRPSATTPALRPQSNTTLTWSALRADCVPKGMITRCPWMPSAYCPRTWWVVVWRLRFSCCGIVFFIQQIAFCVFHDECEREWLARRVVLIAVGVPSIPVYWLRGVQVYSNCRTFFC